MVSTSQTNKDLLTIIDEHTTPYSPKRVAQIETKIKKSGSNPRILKNKKALDGIIDDYLAASIATKYPLLSPELFEIKRYLTFELQNHRKWVLIRDNSEADAQKHFYPGKKRHYSHGLTYQKKRHYPSGCSLPLRL